MGTVSAVSALQICRLICCVNCLHLCVMLISSGEFPPSDHGVARGPAGAAKKLSPPAEFLELVGANQGLSAALLHTRGLHLSLGAHLARVPPGCGNHPAGPAPAAAGAWVQAARHTMKMTTMKATPSVE